MGMLGSSKHMACPAYAVGPCARQLANTAAAARAFTALLDERGMWRGYATRDERSESVVHTVLNCTAIRYQALCANLYNLLTFTTSNSRQRVPRHSATLKYENAKNTHLQE